LFVLQSAPLAAPGAVRPEDTLVVKPAEPA
jgi:hypothetical protein